MAGSRDGFLRSLLMGLEVFSRRVVVWSFLRIVLRVFNLIIVEFRRVFW